MLLDEDVRRWHDNLSRGSSITAEVYLRRLSLFCEKNGLSARTLVETAKNDRKAVEDLVLDFVTKMEKEGKSPGYIAGLIKAVRSWLRYNDFELKRRIKIRNPSATPTIEDERIPTQEELRTIFIYASGRAKTSIALMAFAGLRPQTLGNESGTGGLRLRDLPEMTAEGERVRFDKIPTRVVVRATLSKARHKYFTFLPTEGCEYLAAYLDKRIAEGEELTPDSAVVAVATGYERIGKTQRNKGSRFITTRNVTRKIREAIRPRFHWRPYVMRAYFDSQMLLGESHGKISPAYRTFFMGHKGNIEARYTTHKGRLPDHLIEDMRKSFEKCEEYLSTTQRKAVVDLEMAKIESLLAFAKLQRFPEEKISSIRQALAELETPTADKVIELLSGSADLSATVTIRQKPTDEKASSETKLETTGEPTQNTDRPFEARIIDETEITGFLEMGFDIVATTSDGKFVVRRKNHLI
jgi:hypothetical protein